MKATSPNLRFREAREYVGLSPEQVAERCGVLSPEGVSCCIVSPAGIWDIESHEDELTSCYSPRQLQQLCRVLEIRPVELFGDKVVEPAISVEELALRIHGECRARGVTLEQFEDAVGWRLSACLQPPEKLLEDMTIDGLQWLCRELHVDWRRVLLSL